MLPAKTASFPHSTGRRRGTAVSDERIIPVLYSPPVSSTPRTPKATTAKMTPFRLVVTGLKAALSAQLKVWYWLAVTAENSAPRPVISTTAASRVHMVDRKERNLVNSESSTPALGHPQRGHPGRGRCRGGGGEDAAHWAAPAAAASPARKSTEWSVSCMECLLHRSVLGGQFENGQVGLPGGGADLPATRDVMVRQFTSASLPHDTTRHTWCNALDRPAG